MARRFLASGPSARKISETSNSVVGHTSGQWVKPKNTRNGSPLKSCSVIGLSFCSTTLNRPPTVETATGAGVRPVTMKIAAENSTSPATKAPSASKRRAVRGVIDDSRLAETGDQPGADHLEKNGGAVMRPQRHGAGQHETQRPCRDHDSGAAWRNSIRDREVFRHSHH